MAIYLVGVGANSSKLTVGGVDLTDHCRSVDINQTYDQVDDTAFGAVNRAFLVGLSDASITVEFYQDFAASSVDVTLTPLLGSSTGTTVVFQSNGATVSATAPKWTQVSGIFEYHAVNGAIGEVSTTNVTFKPISGQTLTRATS